MHCQSNRRPRSTQTRSSERQNLPLNGQKRTPNGRADGPRMYCAGVGMRQFTVSEKVVECDSEPDVAFTVMVYVVD